MRIYKSLIAFTGGLVLSPYSPTPVRKAGELAHGWYRAMEGVVRSKRYGVVLFVASAVFFALSFGAFLLSLPSHKASAKGISAVASARTAVGTRVTEIHIANNGLVLLRGARVLSMNGPTITVTLAWGSDNFTWQVNTDASSYETRTFGTRFFDKDNNKISLENIRVGDYLTVTGMIGGSTQQPTLDASAVRKS